jgi:hypothetical protein
MSLNDNTEKDKAIEKINNWLKEEGYTVKEKSDPKSYYCANIFYPKQNTPYISIDIPKDSLDKIHVGTIFGYKLIEKTSNFFDDANYTNKFYVAFVNTLESLNVRYTMDADVQDTEIKIQKVIYFDGLSKHVLFETIGNVLAACRALNLEYKQLSTDSDM